MNILTLEDVVAAKKRIESHIVNTPVVSSNILNQRLNNQIFFKLDSHQVTGSFKVRGAFNHLLNLKGQNKLPKKIVAVSSGNHAQAVAYVAKILNIEALIYTSKVTSKLKIKETRSFGAEVIVTEKRIEANELAVKKIKEGYHFIHPSDNDDVICGQGTSCLEALEEVGEIDMIFSPCGGGGLASGSYLAAQKLKNKPQIFAVEPEKANDAVISLKNNKIYHFDDSPNTIADGARSLSISDRTFHYLKEMTGVVTATEEEIVYWTQHLHHLLKSTIEPTSAMAMAGCVKLIKESRIKNKKILIIISGGNISVGTHQKIWQKSYLA